MCSLVLRVGMTYLLMGARHVKLTYHERCFPVPPGGGHVPLGGLATTRISGLRSNTRRSLTFADMSSPRFRAKLLLVRDKKGTTGRINLRLRAAAVSAFLLGTVALAFGFAMSFLVPGTPGDHYFQRNRVLFGNLPLLAAILMLFLSGWLLHRSVPESKRNLPDTIACCIGGSVGLICVFAMVGALVHQR